MFSVKPHSVLCLSVTAALVLSGCEREVKPAPPFKRTEYNRVVIGNSVEPATLDPQKAGEMAANTVIRQLMDGLTASDGEGKTIPGLATHWESQGDRIWTFHLRDAQWSNGDPITADDFVYSFRRLTDPKTGGIYGGYLADGKVLNADAIMQGKARPETLGVKALDKKTLQFTLTESVPYFPDMMVMAWTYPVHRATVEKYGDKWTQPEHYVSSGAYLLKGWRVNSHIKMEKNPKYYDHDSVSIPAVTMLPAGNEYNRYRADEVDVTYSVPQDQIKPAEKEFPGQVRHITSLCTWYLEPNLRTPPFDNPKVRRALSMLTDRNIVTKVAQRGDRPAYQLTSPDMQGVDQIAPDWKDWSHEKKVAEATRLLNEAGYNDSKPLTFEVLYSTNESSRKQISALRSIWKTAVPFIEASLINQEWKTYQDTRNTGSFTLSFGGWCPDFNDPSSMLNIFRAGSANNVFHYENRAFDKLLDDTLSAGRTPEERTKLYTQAEAMLQQDTAFIPLYHQVMVNMVKPDIRGYSDHDPLLNYVVKRWSFAPETPEK